MGGAIGIFLGRRLPDRLRQTVMAGLGIFTLALGIQMFLSTKNALVVLASLLVGGLLGEWWQIERGLQNIGIRLEGWMLRTNEGVESRFVRGFLVSSLLFCVGPMAILGSVQDGLTGNFQTLAVKSVLDAFASMAFASTFGIGVLFSSLPILIYQGGISLVANQVQFSISESMITEMTATGGVILMAVAISGLLEIKRIRSGNFLPGLMIAPVLVFLLQIFGWF